jgi:signal transduction histidine kinase
MKFSRQRPPARRRPLARAAGKPQWTIGLAKAGSRSYLRIMAKLRGSGGRWRRSPDPLNSAHRLRTLVTAAFCIALPLALAAGTPVPAISLLGGIDPRLLLVPAALLIPVLVFLRAVHGRAGRFGVALLLSLVLAGLVVGLVGASLALFALVAVVAAAPLPLMLVMVLSALVAATLLGRSLHRTAAELSVRRRRLAVEVHRRTSARLIRRIVVAREEERDRLRRDLHDGLGPALSGLRLRLDTAAAHTEDGSPAHQLIADAASETSRVAEEVRRAIDDLRPTDLDHRNLPYALRRLTGRLEHGGMRVNAEVPESAPPLSEATELAAYRIAGEGLTNAVRHSGASMVTVRLAFDDRQVILDVADDGRMRPGPAQGGGLGIRSMARRAEDVGGRCLVLTRPGESDGTVIRAILPRHPR